MDRRCQQVFDPHAVLERELPAGCVLHSTQANPALLPPLTPQAALSAARISVIHVNTVAPLAPGPYLPSSTVSTQWLADHLGADNLAVVAAAGRGRLLSRRLDTSATVIVFDDSDGLCAAESARTLREAGFERVAVLTGGRARWLSEKRPGDLDSLSRSGGIAALHPGDVEPRLA
jgi:rhodanese-related sulfurtransferase